jgi:hypothetical protein
MCRLCLNLIFVGMFLVACDDRNVVSLDVTYLFKVSASPTSLWEGVLFLLLGC